MSVPGLPDTFGNYAIAGIREVLPPDPVSWLPVTVGWQVLGLLLLALACWFVVRRWRRWQANRYRRDALAALARAGGAAPTERLETIAVLLKTTALQAWPRHEVAALSGPGWVEWLEDAGASFSPASRELLTCGQYRRERPADGTALDSLAEETAAWIREHRGAQP